MEAGSSSPPRKSRSGIFFGVTTGAEKIGIELPEITSACFGCFRVQVVEAEAITLYGSMTSRGCLFGKILLAESNAVEEHGMRKFQIFQFDISFGSHIFQLQILHR